MSTGAECHFEERKPRQWFYDLQRWPYGDWPESDTYGPFETFDQALKHLNQNHANPGGFSRKSLPGCEHDLTKPLAWPRDDYTHECLRCGDWVKRE